MKLAQPQHDAGSSLQVLSPHGLDTSPIAPNTLLLRLADVVAAFKA